MKAITLTLDEKELQAFQGLLDVALRQAGLNALPAVSHFSMRLADAQNQAEPAGLTAASSAK
ncbi:hypothetical protein Rvan_3336 [Rhodomicrobium vannielii ATCC 17100]|uniref:Uncharacterized protein n=1 Tax=Rhodomicrobium vannielii (strain ATCC 17100 / DSM 162 / LMG 4299 / NCIMB 10020 / ATH 3.1.1) TaxID=648757 RepID=E3I2S6_RHOVT|nr:hypothetical protein [Rhodomicrobium vannielii]ADP72521.1 hypothetical protein Rvan_3336 [Rhodomicrobium vannielii ATCC 17100]